MLRNIIAGVKINIKSIQVYRLTDGRTDEGKSIGPYLVNYFFDTIISLSKIANFSQ